MNKEFFLIRFIKKVFVTGIANILPTLLVISILVIAYSFLVTHLGSPINALIKKQLAGPWSDFSITYLNIDPELFEPVSFETYEELVKRVQEHSHEYQAAKQTYDEIRNKFQEEALDKIQKRASSSDPDYIAFLDHEIEKLRKLSGLDEAEKIFDIERLKLKKEIDRENENRLSDKKRGDTRNIRLKEELDKKWPNVIGLLLGLFFIFLLGIIFTSFIGNSFKRFWESTLESLPLVSKIYPYAKQLTDFLFKEKTNVSTFQSVVAIEYPRKGIFSIGFLTGEGMLKLKTDTGKNLVSLFIPSSPTPFTGYTIMVDESELYPLDISVEEAIRFCVTGGVVKPGFVEKKSEDGIQSLSDENSSDRLGQGTDSEKDSKE